MVVRSKKTVVDHFNRFKAWFCVFGVIQLTSEFTCSPRRAPRSQGKSSQDQTGDGASRTVRGRRRALNGVARSGDGRDSPQAERTARLGGGLALRESRNGI